MKLSDVIASLKESDKSRLYLISLMALHWTPPRDLVTFQYATIEEAQSIVMARDIACQKANEMWPKEKGFISRKLTVDPFRPSDIERLLELWKAGWFAKHIEPSEEGFEYDCDTGKTMPSRSPRDNGIIRYPDVPPF